MKVAYCLVDPFLRKVMELVMTSSQNNQLFSKGFSVNLVPIWEVSSKNFQPSRSCKFLFKDFQYLESHYFWDKTMSAMNLLFFVYQSDWSVYLVYITAFWFVNCIVTCFVRIIDFDTMVCLIIFCLKWHLDNQIQFNNSLFTDHRFFEEYF